MPRQDRLRALLDLAYDASSYLRRSPSPAVRASAALLLAASLAACSGAGDTLAPTGGKSGAEVTTVKALAREVRAGLPDKPGRYPVHKDSIGRDQQGVYFFAWRAQDEPEQARHDAAVSLLRLLQAEEDSLEIVERGDPVLRLRRDTPVQLVGATTPKAGSTTVYHGPSMPWFPFFLMTSLNPTPVYHDPPRTVQSGSRVEGSRTSTSPAPLSERSIGVQNAVSGRAGGAGSGTAVTSRTGGGTSAGGVSAAKSGSFSSGSGGSTSAGSSGG